ncbi:MAG: adenylate/guanylate cyclase domain-containing protein [Pseudomonadota bacterium]
MTKSALSIVGIILTALITLHLSGVESLRMPFVDALERQAYDLRVRASANAERDTRVVIIDVDERSLQTGGQWPWPRALFAKLVDRLFDDYHIDSLGFDITFPEPENRYQDQHIEQLVSQNSDATQLLAALREGSGDQQFAASFANRTVVLGSVFQTVGTDDLQVPSVGVLAAPLFENAGIDYATILDETLAPVKQRHTSNIPVLANSASATGFFSIAEEIGDPDGILRRVELLNRYGDRLYASLALQMVQSYFQDEVQPVIVSEPGDGYRGLEALRLILGDIPLDEEAAVYVPYSQPRLTYEYVPAVDILTGQYSGDISGALALVGTSAAGLVDMRNTPVSAALPGVEVHANVVSAILDSNFRVKPSWVRAADILAVVLVGVVLSLLLPRLSALWGTITFIVTAGATVWINWFFWADKLMILTLAPILLIISMLYILNMVVGFFSESQARRMTQKMFGLYVPPEVVGEISDSTDIFSLKPEKRELTVLFCDIRDFTSISENMDPEKVSEWLNDFLTPMTKIIHKHGGAIDKYMGDAVMAFWGAPIADAEHARHAVQAALEMSEYVHTLNNELRARGELEIAVGIGVNTGVMSVGNMGSEFRMAYTVVGDAVNIGARLEGLTREYEVPIIASEYTCEQAPEFNYQFLGSVTVKGKTKPLNIYSCNP